MTHARQYPVARFSNTKKIKHSAKFIHLTFYNSNMFGSVFLDNDKLLLSPPTKQCNGGNTENDENIYEEHNVANVTNTAIQHLQHQLQSQPHHHQQQQQQQQQQQLVQFINHSLTNMGAAVVDPSTTVATLNIIHQLLNQRKTDSELLEDARMKINKLNSDKTRLLSDKTRLRSQINLLEQDVASLTHTGKRREADTKKAKRQCSDVRIDLEVQIRKLKQKDTSYIAHQRKHETIIDSLKQKISKLLKKKESSPRNSPRNSPRHSFSNNSSPRVSLRQSQVWATKAAVSMPTSTDLKAETINQLNRAITQLNSENKELRSELQDLTLHFQTIVQRTNRIERLWNMASQHHQDTEAKELDTESFDNIDRTILLPHEWVRHDMHTIKIKFKAIRKSIAQLETEMENNNSVDEQEMTKAEYHNLLTTARRIVYNQDELIQSTLYHQKKNRRIFTGGTVPLTSVQPMAASLSTVNGVLSLYDVECLVQEEKDISLQQDWLAEERKLLLQERKQLERQRTSSASR